jgi:hypothetical protein
MAMSTSRKSLCSGIDALLRHAIMPARVQCQFHRRGRRPLSQVNLAISAARPRDHAARRCVAVQPLRPVSPGPLSPLRRSARCEQCRTPARRRRCPEVWAVRPARPPRRLLSLARLRLLVRRESRAFGQLYQCTGGEYRRVRHDLHFNAASSFHIGMPPILGLESQIRGPETGGTIRGRNARRSDMHGSCRLPQRGTGLSRSSNPDARARPIQGRDRLRRVRD